MIPTDLVFWTSIGTVIGSIILMVISFLGGFTDYGAGYGEGPTAGFYPPWNIIFSLAGLIGIIGGMGLGMIGTIYFLQIDMTNPSLPNLIIFMIIVSFVLWWSCGGVHELRDHCRHYCLKCYPKMGGKKR